MHAVYQMSFVVFPSGIASSTSFAKACNVEFTSTHDFTSGGGKRRRTVVSKKKTISCITISIITRKNS
jgi:hypothetical protein